MRARSPTRWLIPVAGALVLAGAAAGLSSAQPVPAPAPQAAAPPTSIDEALRAAGAAEEPPPPAAAQGPAAPGSTLVDADEAKEKPAKTTPLPEKAPTPLKRPRRMEAIIQTLDKVTAETVRFSATVNKPVRWKDLVFTVRACEEPADDETERGAFVNLEVYSDPRSRAGRAAPPSRLLYRGWMFSEAPAVHPFEHPVYDVWLIACRTAVPSA